MKGVLERELFRIDALFVSSDEHFVADAEVSHVHELSIERVRRVENRPTPLDRRRYVRNTREDIYDERRVNDD
jgi:hypothetical protein